MREEQSPEKQGEMWQMTEQSAWKLVTRKIPRPGLQRFGFSRSEVGGGGQNRSFNKYLGGSNAGG